MPAPPAPTITKVWVIVDTDIGKPYVTAPAAVEVHASEAWAKDSNGGLMKNGNLVIRRGWLVTE